MIDRLRRNRIKRRYCITKKYIFLKAEKNEEINEKSCFGSVRFKEVLKMLVHTHIYTHSHTHLLTHIHARILCDHCSKGISILNISNSDSAEKNGQIPPKTSKNLTS